MSRSDLALVLAVGLLAACSGAPASAPSGAPASTAVLPKPTYTPIPTATPNATPLPTAAATAAPDFGALPVAANDAAALAQQLVMVEAAIRDPKVAGAQLKWFGHLEQLIFGRLADFPDWRDPVVAALPAEVQPVVTNAMEAGRQLRMMHGVAAKSLPNWRILTPPAPEDLVGFYRESEAEFGVPWYFLASIHLIESRMGRIRGDSSAGAQGPMQFMPPTWAAYGKGDVNDPRDSILAAGRYLKAAGAPRDMPKAIFAYNHSTRYVNAVTAYAEAMRLDPNAFRGFHGWQVYYWLEDGPVLLPEGWTRP